MSPEDKRLISTGIAHSTSSAKIVADIARPFVVLGLLVNPVVTLGLIAAGAAAIHASSKKRG